MLFLHHVSCTKPSLDDWIGLGTVWGDGVILLVGIVLTSVDSVIDSV